MKTPLQILMEAGDLMEKRLRINERLAMQSLERGDTMVELHVREYWEPADTLAVASWNAAKAEAQGQTPLFPETLSPTVQRDLLGNFLDLTSQAQEEEFNRSMRRLERATGAALLDDAAWLDIWATDRTRAMEALVYALDHRRPVSADVPPAMEVALWKGCAL